MINSDDPRLTAYALGELDDAERSEVESALATSPELQAEVESIRQTAALFDTSLQADSGPALTEQQRLAIQEQFVAGSIALAGHTTHAKGRRWHRYTVPVAATGIVASLLIAILLPTVQSALESARRVADGRSSLPSSHYLADEGQYFGPATVSSPHPNDTAFAGGEGEQIEGFDGPSPSIGLSPASPTPDFDFSFREKSFGTRQAGAGGFDETAPQDSVSGVDIEANVSRGAMGFDVRPEERGSSSERRSRMQPSNSPPSDAYASEELREGDVRDRPVSGPIDGCLQFNELIGLSLSVLVRVSSKGCQVAGRDSRWILPRHAWMHEDASSQRPHQGPPPTCKAC